MAVVADDGRAMVYQGIFRYPAARVKYYRFIAGFGSAYFTEPNSDTIRKHREPIRSFNPEGIESK